MPLLKPGQPDMRTPKYSVSQKIGNLGERVFVGGHPDTWTLEGTPKQGGDFGFDQSMWFEDLGHIAGRFSVQLKAGASPKFTTWDEPTVPVDLSPEVCNLYLQDGNPVLLVFVALESENSSENASMYYSWIEEDLPARLEGREIFDGSDPDKMRFHIPLSQKLTKQTNVQEHLEEYWNHTRMANRLRGPHGTAALSVVSSLSPRGISALTATSPKILERRLINESMIEGHLWSTPKTGTTVAKIKQTADFITQGNTKEADRILGELQVIGDLDSDEQAAISFQQGRRHLLDGDVRVALKNFANASSIRPDSANFFAAELEATVVVHIGTEAGVPLEIIKRSDKFSNDPEVQFQLVRIHALEGEFTEAETLLEKLAGSNKRKATTLYFAIRCQWKDVIASAKEGEIEGLSARDQLFLDTLRVRAFLNIVLGEEDEISVGGRPGLAVSDAIGLRDASLEALRSAQDAGWPSNSEILLDCAAATTAIFGPNSELLSLIADYAKKRPKLSTAQSVLATIATFMDEPDTAVSALRRLDTLDSPDAARLVLLLSESGRHGEAVSLALKQLISQKHSMLIDMAVGMAAVSAYRLGSTSEEAALRDYVSEGDPAARSLLRFISESIKHPEKRKEHIDQLWNDSVSGTGNETLQNNLFLYLRPNREEDVDRIIELALTTQRRRNLTQMESAKFSAALLRRESFEEVVVFTERAQEMFPEDENIGLTRAVALDKLGQSSAAEFSLRRFETSSRQDLLNARSQLLLRIGEVEAAVSLVQQALSAAKNHADKFSNQRILATLYSRIDPSRHLDAVWRLGEIANQDAESEEGTFLVHFVLATSGANCDASQDQIDEFHERVQRFSDLFPKSKIFRVGSISESAPAEELFAHLREISGITEEQARVEMRARQFGERSGSHVPFSFRPRKFTPFASNIVDLLRITINAWHKGEASRVIVGDAEHPIEGFSAPPIIDLATLFALVDLGLFEKLFGIWTAVAIPQVSLGTLAELQFEPLNMGNVELVDEVVDALRRHHSSIVQPNVPAGASNDFPFGELETIKSEISSGRFEYLTFDLASAAALNLLEGTPATAHTIWDLLHLAEIKGLISSAESTLVRLRVASWNSRGVPLQAKDIAAASLGAVSQEPYAADDSPVARATQQFITSGNLVNAMDSASHTLIELAKNDDAASPEAANWFIRLFYRESVLAHSTGFKGDADELTARLAVFGVRDAHDEPNALRIMQRVWRALEQARTSFGGHWDRERFHRVLGTHAANLFDSVIKKIGFDAIGIEAKLRELLFSLATSGTHDREVLETAFYERTLALQKE